MTKKIRKFMITTAIIGFSTVSLTAINSKNIIKKEKNIAVGNYDISNDLTLNADTIVSIPNWTHGDNFGTQNFADVQATMAETRNHNEFLDRKNTGQPFALHYHTRDLPNWSPEGDADQAWSVGTIPLADRQRAYKILETELHNKFDVLAALNRNTSGTYASTSAFDYEANRIFTMWSNINTMVNWGGSSTEGIVLVPKGNDINLAHKNGVPILGTVFFPPNGYGGKEQMYRDLLVKVNDTYPAADKLVEMCQHYGFDGWFFNMETYASSDTINGLNGFLDYFYAKMHENNLFVNLYDYGIGSRFYSRGVFDYASIDFQHRYMNYNLPQEQYGYGYDYGNGHLSGRDQGGTWSTYNQNTWIYTYFDHDPIVNGDDTDLRFFSDSGGNRDVRHDNQDAWHEPGRYFTPYSIIDGQSNFNTTFQIGGGHHWYHNGEALELSDWLNNNGYRNAGIQSILPTWKYIFDAYDKHMNLTSIPGDFINVDLQNWHATIDDLGSTYNGSTKLHITGNLTPLGRVSTKLFAANTILEGDETFSLIVKNDQVTPQIALWVDDNPLPRTISYSQKQDLGHDFSQLTFNVDGASINHTMRAFGLFYSNDFDQVQNVDSNISQMSFNVSPNHFTENKITALRNDGNYILENERRTRITWDMQDNSQVDHYLIYGSNDDTFSKDYLHNVTAIPAAYLHNLPNKESIPLIIEAYDKFNNQLSTNNVLLQTIFGPKDDLSRWSVNYIRPTDANANYIKIFTGNGFNDSYQNNNQIFFGDDYAHIYSLDQHGTLLAQGSDQWGHALLANNNDVKTTFINQYDQDHILAITSMGSVHVLNKTTGEPKDTIDTNGLKNWLINQFGHASRADEKNLLGEITYFEHNQNGFVILGNLDDQQKTPFAVLWKNDGSYQKINLNINDAQIVAVDQNQLVYNQNNQSFLADFTLSDDSETLMINTDHSANLNTAVDNFVNDEFRNQINASANDANFLDNTSLFTNAKIVYLKELPNGKTLLINELGIALLVDQTQVHVTSLISPDDWAELKNNMYQTVHDPSHRGIYTPGYHVSDIINFVNNFNSQKILSHNLINFDPETNKLIIGVANNFEYAWQGFERVLRNFLVFDTTALFDGQVNDFTAANQIVSLSTENNKKIDDLRFIEQVEDIYLIGGSTGRLAILNQNLDQISFGFKQYSYDNQPILEVEHLYNDGDNQIPASIMN